MNKVMLMGRLTRDPEVRYSQGENSLAIARYTAERYLKQGTKLVVTGRIQTGSYTNKDGQKVYTTEVVVEDQEFAESKSSNGDAGFQQTSRPAPSQAAGDGFMNIPDGIDEELPFN
ncbi:MAG: single-stranded DNA-binding protein Ssb [Anaerocolumna sp.]|nr:single-stranded DNA-binding protein Ssb [Anaerocolumna sp.]